MPPTQELARRAAFYMACGSAVAMLVSIALSHILLALALAALLVSGEKQIGLKEGEEFVRFSGVVNPNTIARAYLQLQADEVVESLRGRGLAVCTGAPQRCRTVRRELIAQRLRSALAEALHGGLKATEIREIVRRELESLSGTVNPISSNPDQAVPP